MKGSIKKPIGRGMVAFLVITALTIGAGYMRSRASHVDSKTDTLLLLLPDAQDPRQPQVQEWLDAAEEEGLHMEIVRDSMLLNPMHGLQGAGLIVPDEVHKEANDALIGALYAYAHDGGKVMFVYDACTWDLNGYCARFKSRLSGLAGIDYALYDRYGKDSIAVEQVWGDRQAMSDLEIPPGKFVPLKNKEEFEAAWLQPAPSSVRATSEAKASHEERFALSRYFYRDLKYPSFRTAGGFDGHVLLTSGAGVVAGLRKYGLGDVLFVNAPLGYLKLRTDGLLLHSFLHYFAVDVLKLPYLSAAPDGVGGLILNWHVDDRRALTWMAVLEKAGIFDQGPYSFDFTAGPGVSTFEDGKGLDIDHNPEAQRWIKELASRGNVIGDHGGWIHNYFGENLTETNEGEFEQYLVLNNESMERAVGQKILEYSAPVGNQPEWVTHWLQAHGFLAYYFPGDSGMGATRAYRDDGRVTTSTWAFPILHLGIYASMEEMSENGVPDSTVEAWLKACTDFTANDHIVRMVYTHPLGASIFLPVLQKWMQYTQQLKNQNYFRWYTMTEIARFMNSRLDVKWSIISTPGSANEVLQATHPKSLEHETWVLPQSVFREVHVTSGSADVRKADGRWLITARNCKHLAVELDPS